jgi:phosphatidylserine/phosphatidylglycerophosphate/cardiolipin synthase-like enzyme
MKPRQIRLGCPVLGGTVVAATVAVVFIIYQALTGAGPLLTVADPTPQPGAIDETNLDEWFSVYFSEPQSPAAGTLRGGPDAVLAEAIQGARLTVDVAMYDLDLWSIRDALQDAYRRGVTVRVVAESDNLDEPEFEALAAAGIPVLGDRREGLMHHKFVVIDRLEVWTGSMNFTLNGAYRNDNNLVRVRSARLAENYLAEFEEMFSADRFGSLSRADTPYPAITVSGVPLEVYFSPDDGVAARLVELIEGAEARVDFLAFSFTADDLAEALLDQARRGVQVRGVFEARQVDSNIGTEYGRLRGAGLDVHLDGNPKNMHHKVIIIDSRIVIAGSYNFSASAEQRNDENVLVIHSTAVAAHYLDEFARVMAQAQP